MGSVAEMPLEMERSMRRATILGLGTANPPNAVDQSNYPDYYFKLTKSEHMADLKKKFTRICNSSAIDNRYCYVTMPEIIQEKPSLCSYDANTLNIRQELMDVQMPKLGAEAATEAIKDWGRPMSEITHLIFCNSGGASMPGADYDVIKILGLPLSTKRFMLHQQGCFGGGSVLRLAKDLAENNVGARILVICCEIVTTAFRGPSEDHVENLVAQAIFGDGASAAIVGAGPSSIERTIFEIVWTAQNILPWSDGCIVGKLREGGLMVTLQPGVPLYIAGNAKELVADALRPVGITDLNDVFWVVHPGGRAILDAVEQTLKLKEDKFSVAREVLREYGNMSSASVMFVMDLMRKRSKEKGLSTAGEGLEWGILFCFGPGITAETILLRCPQ